MATQSEDAILNVKINGQDAISTFTQLNKLRNDQIALVKKLNENTPEYDAQIQKLTLLNTQYDAWKQKIYGVTEASSSLASELKTGLTSAVQTLGVSLGAAGLVTFTKDLINLEATASGVEMAFSKLGNTDGLLDKLRTASRGLMSDLDLDKLAIKANNANIPLDKMGTFLAFATQRAKDTGESVDELSTRLIEGIGKNSPKALSGLGISVKEVRDDFKQTGDMVTTVANIITRQMAQSGTDVDTFGDKVESMASRWANIKESAGNFMQSVLMPQLADPKMVAQQTDNLMKQYDGYQKFSDAQLKDAMSKAQQTKDLYKTANDNAQKAMTDLENTGFWGKLANTVSAKAGDVKATAKSEAEDYQAARNVLDALSKEQEKRDAKAEANKSTPGQAAKLAQEEEKAQAEAVQKQTDLGKSLQALNAQELADTKSTFDKEIAAVKAKYAEFIKSEEDYQAWVRGNKNLSAADKKTDIAASNGRIGNASDNQETALNQLRVKQAKETTDEIKKYQDDQAANFSGNLDKELQKNKDFYDNLTKQLAGDDWLGRIEIESAQIVSNAKTTAAAKLAEEKKYEDELQQLRDKDAEFTQNQNLSERARIQATYDAELAMYAAQLKKKEISFNQYLDLTGQAHKNYNDANNKADQDSFKKYEALGIEAAEKVASTAFSIAQANRNSDLEAETSKLEEERKQELSQAGLSASQKTAINNKYDQEEAAAKLKKWQADQDASLEQAIINTALGVTKAIPNIPLEIEAAAAGAAQIAVIESAKAPTFEDGGLLPTGPSHAAGGLNVVDPLGNLVANIEGGEPILSRKTAAANPNLVKALMASGGQTINYERILNAATASKTTAPVYAGDQTASGSNSFASTGYSATSISAQLDRMEALHAKTMQLITQVDSKPVVLSNRVFNDNATKLAQITDSVNG